MRGAAFTLAEVLITLGVIGVVAAMTMPSLIASHQEKELVTGVLKFNSTLSQAVMNWRTNSGEIDITNPDGDPSKFDTIAKELRFISKCVSPQCKTADWLPDFSYDYYGIKGTDVSYGTVAKSGYGNACYLLVDGMAFCLDINPENYCVTVDVNGKKKPNRVGRDIFSFTIGYLGHDVLPGELHRQDYVLTARGTCMVGSCDADNLDPTIKGGAAPTSYVIANHKLPPLYNR